MSVHKDTLMCSKWRNVLFMKALKNGDCDVDQYSGLDAPDTEGRL